MVCTHTSPHKNDDKREREEGEKRVGGGKIKK